jgi:hypothetical protein
LQRVLLSGVLSPSQQQELRAIAKALDPFRLFQQVERLQQATLRCEAGRSSASQPAPIPELLPFDLAGCTAELVLQEAKEADELPRKEQKQAGVLDWRRTSKDPFAGQWGQILAWVQANPTRSNGDILRELQSLYPGRYEVSHLRTLQRGMRKIRIHVLQVHEEAGSPPGLQRDQLASGEFPPARRTPEDLISSFFPVSVCALFAGDESKRSSNDQATEELSRHVVKEERGIRRSARTSSQSEPGKIVRHAPIASARSAKPASSQDFHVGATPRMMKKSRMGEDASTQRSASLCAASQSQG